MTQEERRLRAEQREHMKEMEQAAIEAGKGPVDTPFLILVLLLTGVGLIMLFSASFPSAYYETGKP
ncbi:MAG: cell division protein FtsW, partial [Oscillospiraceae bacterium]|nr:cell division protein FtsW [Oscillospiraceae bacterium]